MTRGPTGSCSMAVPYVVEVDDVEVVERVTARRSRGSRSRAAGRLVVDHRLGDSTHRSSAPSRHRPPAARSCRSPARRACSPRLRSARPASRRRCTSSSLPNGQAPIFLPAQSSGVRMPLSFQLTSRVAGALEDLRDLHQVRPLLSGLEHLRHPRLANSGPSGAEPTCCGTTSAATGRNSTSDSHPRSSPAPWRRK